MGRLKEKYYELHYADVVKYHSRKWFVIGLVCGELVVLLFVWLLTGGYI